MAPRYLCCLPLRFGVLVISFFQFLASGAITGLLAYGLILDAQDKIEFTSRMRISAIVMAGVCGLVALIALTGFIGAIRKSRSAVGVFLNLLRLFFAIQLVSVIAFFVLYFVDKDEFRKLCIKGVQHLAPGDTQGTNTCDETMKRSLAVVIISAIMPLLLQAYGLYIVSAYARKLKEDPYSYTSRGPIYREIGEEARPLTHKGTGPYGDAV